MEHRLDLATRTQISVCKSPFPSAGTAVSLFRAETVQERPLLPREVSVTVLFLSQPLNAILNPFSFRAMHLGFILQKFAI